MGPIDVSSGAKEGVGRSRHRRHWSSHSMFELQSRLWELHDGNSKNSRRLAHTARGSAAFSWWLPDSGWLCA